MRVPALRSPVGVVAALALLLLASPSPAVILKLVHLKEVLEGEQFIFVATVDSVAPDKPAAVFKFAEKLKGDAPFDRLPVNLTGDDEAKKGGHTKVLLDRLKPGGKLVVFAHKKGKRYEAMAFVEGTWFSLLGSIDDDGKTVRWALLHGEPYLRRTFKGTTAELKKVVEDGLAKKADPPAPNEKEPPGFGPPAEVEKKCDDPADDQATGRKPAPAVRSAALFGVIPTVALAGPMAVLMALFPGVAARMSVALKRWRAFLAVTSVNSTLAFAYWLLRERQLLPDWRVFSYQGFTAALLLSTAAGLVWAGWRYRRMGADDPAVTGTPTRRDLGALAGLTALVGLLVASTRLFGPWSMAVDLPMRELTLIGVSLLAATLYAAYRTATDRATGPDTRLSLSGESVGLGTLFLGGVVALFVGGNTAPRSVMVDTQAGDADEVVGPRFADVRVFEVPDAHQVMSEGVAVDGDRLYFGTSRSTSFSLDGAVFCLDRHTGKQLWKYDHDEDMKPVFCTPTAAGGKVYFGEGLHTHSGCRLFCLDAATGKPAWEQPFATGSHTEGHPRLAHGKVYFTAGDDGLYCADDQTGARTWQFEGAAQQLHIDGSPAVAGNRVFVGSGMYTLALLGIDAGSGREVWRTPVDLRSFGPPLVIGDRVVYGLGTGNMAADTVQYGEEKGRPAESEPAGAVVCVAAADGTVAWRYDLSRSVHTSLAADAFSVYAAARDGAVHCLDRKTGKLRWKTTIGTTCTAGPAVATAGGMPVAVYAVSTDGMMVCLNPQTGKVAWFRDLREHTGRLVDEVYATPTVVTEPTPTGSRRVIYTGGMVKNANNGAKAAAVFRFEDELAE